MVDLGISPARSPAECSSPSARARAMARRVGSLSANSTWCSATSLISGCVKSRSLMLPSRCGIPRHEIASRQNRTCKGRLAGYLLCSRNIEHDHDRFKVIIPRALRSCAMIELYYWPTPNGHKITMFLEETGIPYTIVPVNIGKGDQFKPDFLKIAPNNRMPAIVDRAPRDGGAPISVFESGAILEYLGDKTAQFFPADPRKRNEVREWLFWQVGGLGPMAGQNHHFANY